MSQAIYAISGKERKAMKKEASHIKQKIQMCWHWHDLECAHGSDTTAEEANEELQKLKLKHKNLVEALGVKL